MKKPAREDRGGRMASIVTSRIETASRTRGAAMGL